MKITKCMLQAKGACPNQVAVFAKEWPRGATATLKNCKRAAKLGLNVHWVSKNLLPKKLDDAYGAQQKPLYAAYVAQRKPLYDAYVAQRKPLCDAYEAQRKPLCDAYETQCWQVFYKITKGA